ncbi:MAG: glycosyltransferase family 9 protein [Bacteroidota bacterium]
MFLKNHAEALLKAHKIAVVRTDRIGDMMLTLPLCAALKRHCPQAHITMIARKYTEPLLKHSHVIDEALFVEDFTGVGPEFDKLAFIFLQEKYDAVFFPRMVLHEVGASFLSNVPLRIGSGYRWYSMFLNHKIKQHRHDAKFHEAEYNTQMLADVLKTDIATKLVEPEIDIESAERLDKILLKNGIAHEDKYIVIHPGSGGSAHDWPAEKFGELAKILLKERGIKIIITGIESEKAKSEAVLKGCPEAINLCGKLQLDELLPLLLKATLFIGNSSGPLHIAASFETPVVGFYPNSPAISAKRWGPYSKNSLIISPGSGDDMRTISVETAAEKIRQFQF